MRGCPPTPFCLRSDPKKISQKIHLPIANINANVRIKPWKYKLRPPQGSGSSVLPILWDPGTSWNQTPGPLVSMAATHARNSYMRVCIYGCIWRSRDLWAQEGTVEFCYVENFQVFSLLVGVFPPGLHVQVDIPFGAGSNQKDFADPFGLAGKVGEWLIEAFGRWIGRQHDGWAQSNKHYAFHWNYGFSMGFHMNWFDAILDAVFSTPASTGQSSESPNDTTLLPGIFFPFQLRHRGFPGALLLKAGVGDGARRMCCVRLRLGGHRRSTGPRRSSRGPGDGGLEVGREGEAVRLLHRPGEAVAGRFRRGTSSPNKLASPKFKMEEKTTIIWM